MNDTINKQARAHDLEILSRSLRERFLELIQRQHDKYQRRVVVLIDEYDQPILDNITKPEIAVEIREKLKKFLRSHQGRRQGPEVCFYYRCHEI